VVVNNMAPMDMVQSSSSRVNAFVVAGENFIVSGMKF
jgi:hypothetical protein